MKKIKTTVVKMAVLGLFLLGGCSTFEGCDAFYQLIGNMTRGASESTLSLTVISSVLINAMSNTQIWGTQVTAGDSGWYTCQLWEGAVPEVRVTKNGSYVSPVSVTGLTGITLVEVKFDVAGEAENSVLVNLSWTNVTSTPTATGDMTYQASDADCTATYTNLTYDSDGYATSGTSNMTWTTNNALFTDFTVVLNYNQDASAEGTVGTISSPDNLGSVKLSAVKPYAGNVEHYTIDYVKNLDGETKSSETGE
jgi:hypothetical protein